MHEVTVGGRGGKGGLISPTAKALELEIAAVDELALGTIPVDLQIHLSRPTESILADLESADINVKGVALELLALRLATDFGLSPVELRLRGGDTGGAEVDLVAEGAQLHFSRWLFQCKNQVSVVPVSVLAKEVGMATLLRAQVVVIVTTGVFARSVLEYARRTSETTALQVILVDGSSLARYRLHGAAELRSELHRSALQAVGNKRPQLLNYPS